MTKPSKIGMFIKKLQNKNIQVKNSKIKIKIKTEKKNKCQIFKNISNIAVTFYLHEFCRF